MLNLLLQYLKKTLEVWVTALVPTLFFFGILSLFLLIPHMLHIFTSLAVVSISFRLFQMLGFGAIPDVLSIPVLIVLLIYMPALATVDGVAAITSIAFFLIYFDKLALEKVGIGFSLNKLLLNPIGRLETLRPILEGQTLDYAEYLNLVNDIRSPDAAGYCESLKFSPGQETELIERQKQAMTQLPEAFKTVLAAIAASDCNSSNLQATIADKKAFCEEYRRSLRDEQQACLDTFLDSSLGLTHAICCVTLEPLSPENQDQFIMLEKRYKEGENWHAVPHATQFFYFDPEERDVFLNLARYDKALERWTIKNPLIPEPCFTPFKYRDSLTQYRLYKYQVIEGHPLSLEVCEAIEAFNRSMQIIDEKNPIVVEQNNSEFHPTFKRDQQEQLESPIYNFFNFNERQRKNSDAALSSDNENDETFSCLAV